MTVQLFLVIIGTIAFTGSVANLIAYRHEDNAGWIAASIACFVLVMHSIERLNL